MKYRVFSVYDQKAGAYITPFFMPNDQMAVRAFAMVANDVTHPFYKFGADYTLFCVAEFDDLTGALTALAPHKSFGAAASYAKGALYDGVHVKEEM